MVLKGRIPPPSRRRLQALLAHEWVGAMHSELHRSNAVVIVAVDRTIADSIICVNNTLQLHMQHKTKANNCKPVLLIGHVHTLCLHSISSVQWHASVSTLDYASTYSHSQFIWILWVSFKAFKERFRLRTEIAKKSKISISALEPVCCRWNIFICWFYRAQCSHFYGTPDWIIQNELKRNGFVKIFHSTALRCIRNSAICIHTYRTHANEREKLFHFNKSIFGMKNLLHLIKPNSGQMKNGSIHRRRAWNSVIHILDILFERNWVLRR